MSIQRRNLLLSALPLSAALFLEAGLQPLVAESEMEEPSFDQDTYDLKCPSNTRSFQNALSVKQHEQE
jgi:hypothetical protein